MPMRTSRCKRHGVVLLVILGLLAMFGMTAVALVMVTRHHQRAATTAARINYVFDPHEQVLHEAMLQVVRGTNNRNSVIGPHSLLEDMYGHRSLTIQITDPQPIAGGQLVSFSWSLAGSGLVSNQLVGAVITFLDGDAAGQSTCIVGLDATGGRIIVQNLPNSGLLLNSDPRKVETSALVNGLPFCGTGAGYDSNTGRCDFADPNFSIPVALLPNPTAYPDINMLLGNGGSMNEDYDAVDYQNMLLALQVGILEEDKNGNGQLDPWEDFNRNGILDPPYVVTPIPSLHRPEVVLHVLQRQIPNLPPYDPTDPTVLQQWQAAFQSLPIQLKRMLLLRPLPELHPGIAEANPRFSPVWDGIPRDLNGDGLTDFAWDVDNDSDGVPDSIWVDLGFPVRQLPDGRYYKPLFAILCVDLDGRFNLNAHGQLAQTQADYYAPPHAVEQTFLNRNTGADDRKLAAVDPNGTLPIGVDTFVPGQAELVEYLAHGVRGSGFGPAEINMLPLFGAPAGVSDYAEILTGIQLSSGERIEGRYGEVDKLGLPPTNVAQPGRTNVDDPLSANKFFNFPPSYAVFGIPHFLGTPYDYRGYLSFALDLFGQPVYMAFQRAWGNWTLDEPYELNLNASGRGLSAPSPVDNPFSLAELERLLRPFDLDVSNLPDRLAMILAYDQSAGITSIAQLRQILRYYVFPRRHEVTTDSWDVPVPSVGIDPRTKKPLFHPLDVVIERMKSNGKDALEIAAELRKMFTPDLLAGLRLDINRPFGNRLDDNNNLAVDEPLEAQAGEAVQYVQPSGPVAVQVDHDNDGAPGVTPSQPPMDSRQLLARSLYVLAMALTPEAADNPGQGQFDYRQLINPALPAGQANYWKARYLAQWAVNVVDFRDRDSIMTRFAFDENPFDGWHEPTDNRHVVWGCERPELLITEAIAFHDRRTEDLRDFGYAKPPTQDDPDEAEEGDGVVDLDQRFRPQGSLFVELYNPWQGASQQSQLEPTNELYTNGGVDLAKRAPDGTPVWRLALGTVLYDPDITNGPKEPPDPDEPGDPAQIQRVVYFVNENLPGPRAGQIQFYTSVDVSQFRPIVRPGGYAVIGSGGPPTGGITYIGWEVNDVQQPTSTRHIVCDPRANPPQPQVAVRNNGTIDPPLTAAAVAVMIDRATNDGSSFRDQRLSITEPVEGYAQYEAGRVDENGQPIQYNPASGMYEDPSGNPQAIDQPLDLLVWGENIWNAIFCRTQTLTADLLATYGEQRICCRVYLQRLADPTRPYDPQTNPYRTIDSMPIDLTVFNGRTDAYDYDSNGNEVDEGTIMFHTRQRGESNWRDNLAAQNPPATEGDFNIWKQEPGYKQVKDDPTNGAPNHWFRRMLKHTLGYLSEPFGPPRLVGDQQSPAPSPVYNGAPRKPFPWLAWFNRPFTTPFELLLVPAESSAKLLTYAEEQDANNPVNTYYRHYTIIDPDLRQPVDVNAYEPLTNNTFNPKKQPFGHLMNFFYSGPISGTGAAAPELHRILQFVRVPSPFVGTETQCNPQVMSGGPQHDYHPPFHSIPTWREPGKINLNTVVSERVWQGLLNLPALAGTPTIDENQDGDPRNDPFDRFVQRRFASGLDPFSDVIYDPDGNPNSGDEEPTTLWHRFLQSRRGYAPAAPQEFLDPIRFMLRIDPQYPTRFANPFRSFAGAYLVPTPELQNVVGREVNATLLRQHPQSGVSGRPARGLFEVESQLYFNNTDRNPFFRYRHLMRLSNLVTTRSNVYAVWITVGYFEAIPAESLIQDWNGDGTTGDPADWQIHNTLYPDGWAIGPELGSDTGEVQRHRMFFIIDRSIPVGFQRGKDLNVENAVVIKRYIE